MAWVVAACGGGRGGSGTDDPSPTVTPPGASTLSMTLNGVKSFGFTWTASTGATYYKLVEDPDGSSGYSAITGATNLTGTSYDHLVPLYKRINARYIVQACNSGGCTDSAALSVSGDLAAAVGYGKASNTDSSDFFGTTLAISSDGTTLVVGAYGEDSSSTGVNGSQDDNSANSSGAAYVFVRTGSTWSQEAYLKASNAEAGDYFGTAVAISSDGNTITAGAFGESSAATGVNGSQSDNSLSASGAVYVFTRSGTAWSQQAYVKASNPGMNDLFGSELALSGDGNTLAVGAVAEDSSATGIDGNQDDDTLSGSGAVYVFTRSGTSWSQQAYVKASNTDAGDAFGWALALSTDGNTLAAGAYREDSNSTLINGDQTNNAAPYSGAVYVFTRAATAWSQQAYVKPSNTQAEDCFGSQLTLAGDGNTLAVSSIGEDSGATGVGGSQADESVEDSGAAYVFTRTGTEWSQQAYVKASNTGENGGFGSSLSLAADGNTLAVGAYGEASSSIGINGNQADESSEGSGAVYVFGRVTGTWSQIAYVKAPNVGRNDNFGGAVELAADGNTLVAGAASEDSAASGIGGNQNDDSASSSGAIYIY